MKAYILTAADDLEATDAPRVELRDDHIAIVADVSDVRIDRDTGTIAVRSRAAARHLAYLLCLAEDASDPEQFAVLAPAPPEPKP